MAFFAGTNALISCDGSGFSEQSLSRKQLKHFFTLKKIIAHLSMCALCLWTRLHMRSRWSFSASLRWDSASWREEERNWQPASENEHGLLPPLLLLLLLLLFDGDLAAHSSARWRSTSSLGMVVTGPPGLEVHLEGNM